MVFRRRGRVVVSSHHVVRQGSLVVSLKSSLNLTFAFSSWRRARAEGCRKEGSKVHFENQEKMGRMTEESQERKKKEVR